MKPDILALKRHHTISKNIIYKDFPGYVTIKMKWKKFFLILFFIFNITTQDDVKMRERLLGLNLNLSVDLLGLLELGGSQDEYDYIVVGSGTAGSALTSELVKNKNIRVLLLETGDEPILGSDVPLFAAIQLLTPQNWGYLMEKQHNFGLGLTDQLMSWPKGKVLGGSTVINMMMHTRGNALDYDRWAQLGNPGWSYAEMLPIFKYLEDAYISVSDPGYHGTGGPLTVTDIPYRTTVVDTFVQAAMETGFAYVDYNGNNQMGVSYIQGTLRNGRRCSAEKAFIRPIRHQANLMVSLNSHVTKVLINETTKTAYGVEYMKNGITYRVKAKKEVILSAGAFHSPQILMLSGIGPQDHLTELGIPVIKNLPVGKKLFDHLAFLGLTFTVNQPIVISFLEVLTTMGMWLLFGIGPLTSISAVESLLFYKTTVATYSENYPDMELILIGGHLHTDYDLALRRMFRISREVYDAVWVPLYDKWAFGIMPMLLHPKSVGHMKLRSKNPFDAPMFYGNYLTDPDGQDLKAFQDAIKVSKKIVSARPFKMYNATLWDVPVPGCEHLTFDTDPYWECALRHISVTLYHQLGTCKMGNATDPEAVVNHKLQVYGIKNLRVADTGIIPIPISAHTNVPTYAIGIKTAQLVLADY